MIQHKKKEKLYLIFQNPVAVQGPKPMISIPFQICLRLLTQGNFSLIILLLTTLNQSMVKKTEMKLSISGQSIFWPDKDTSTLLPVSKKGQLDIPHGLTHIVQVPQEELLQMPNLLYLPPPSNIYVDWDISKTYE